jgi:hypothetical protein
MIALIGCQPTVIPDPPRHLTALERFAATAQFRDRVFYDCTFLKAAPDASGTQTGRFFLGIESPEINGETLQCHSGESSDALECVDRTILAA